MKYKIEQIGSAFTDKGIAALEKELNANANEDYKFHSVFEVTKPGCLGNGGTRTYLAIYTKDDDE